MRFLPATRIVELLRKDDGLFYEADLEHMWQCAHAATVVPVCLPACLPSCCLCSRTPMRPTPELSRLCVIFTLPCSPPTRPDHCTRISQYIACHRSSLAPGAEVPPLERYHLMNFGQVHKLLLLRRCVFAWTERAPLRLQLCLGHR